MKQTILLVLLVINMVYVLSQLFPHKKYTYIRVNKENTSVTGLNGCLHSIRVLHFPIKPYDFYPGCELSAVESSTLFSEEFVGWQAFIALYNLTAP